MGHYAAEMNYRTPAERVQDEIEFRKMEAEMAREKKKREEEWIKKSWKIFAPGDLVFMPPKKRHYNFLYDGYGFNAGEQKIDDNKSSEYQMMEMLISNGREEREAKELKDKLEVLKNACMLENGLLTIFKTQEFFEKKRVYRQEVYFKVIENEFQGERFFGPFEANLFILVSRPKK